MTRTYWKYLFAVGLVGFGYVDFALIAYHLHKSATFAPFSIPLFYSLAMATSGVSAPLMGKLFDRKGIVVLAFVPIVSSLFAPCIFWGGVSFTILGVILWGIGIGAQESIMRAVVSLLVPPNKRGSAYGVMNFVFGGFWALGSAVIGVLYDISLSWVVVVSMVAQLSSIPLFATISLRKDTQR